VGRLIGRLLISMAYGLFTDGRSIDLAIGSTIGVLMA
jgi:hypothetical protein